MAHTITEDCRGCTLCTRICPVGAIHGERKAQHSINPALCIDCGACGKICAFSAISAPSGQRVPHIKQNQWQKPAWNYRKCVACNICVQACPSGAIGQQHLDHTAFPFLSKTKSCLGCSFCADRCPVSAITMQSPAVEEPAPQKA